MKYNNFGDVSFPKPSFRQRIRRLLVKLGILKDRDFASFVTPVIKQVYPTLLINELVKVQPMTEPTGRIFYMDFQRKLPWYKRFFNWLFRRK